MFLESDYVAPVGNHQVCSWTFTDLVFLFHLKIINTILSPGVEALWTCREPIPVREMTMKMKGLLKGLRYIAQIFDSDEEEEEQEMQIGLPTDVKHVAHIGVDGPSVTSGPSWMNEYQSGSEEPSQGSGVKSPESTQSANESNMMIVSTRELSTQTKPKRKSKSSTNESKLDSQSSQGAPSNPRQSRKKKSSKTKGTSSRESSVRSKKADGSGSEFENDDIGMNQATTKTRTKPDSCASSAYPGGPYSCPGAGSNIEELGPIPTFKALKLDERI